MRTTLMAALLRGTSITTVTPVVLPTFALEAETTALVAAWTAAGTTMTTRRQMTFNRGIKRLKNYPVGDPVWPNLKWLSKTGPDLPTTKINIVTPGTYDLTQVGSVTLIANATVTPSSGGYFRITNLHPSDLPVDNYAAGVFSSTGVGANTDTELGSRDATNGITMSIWNSAASTMAARVGGAVVTTIGSASVYDGNLFHAVSRGNSANFTAYKGAALRATVASPSASLPAVEMYYLASNNNGTAAGTTKGLSSGFIANRNLTAAQMKELSAVLTNWHYEMSTGEVDFFEPGVQPQNPSYDVVVYGATMQGVCAAYEAKRQGRTVCIVGGWRERSLGGISAGGLGFADASQHGTASTVYKGLAGYVAARLQVLQNVTSSVYGIEPRFYEQVCRELVDPTKTGGLDIPVYWSSGVASATKNSFTTVDGRKFSHLIWIDASYEGDLLKAKGCTYQIGREAAGAGSEAANGFRGIATDWGSTPNPAANHAGATLIVDPYITPGVASSGLIAGVVGTYGVTTPAQGTTDHKYQAMCYRATLMTGIPQGLPLPSTPPPNYATSNYEILLRVLAQDSTLVMADIFNFNAVDTNMYDFNSKGIMSQDYNHPDSTEYATATYARREQIIKNMQNYWYGLMYLLQYDTDPRIPAALRTQALTYGLSQKHYVNPYSTDDPYFMSAAYVRDPSYQLVSDMVWTSTDLDQADGVVPRSTNTIAAASYTMDRHGIQYLADPNGGTPRVVLEGSVGIEATSGVNFIAPLPYEIIIPKVADDGQGFVPFAVSCSKIAWAEIRLEYTTMMMAQAAGLAAAIAIENGVTVQNVPYSTLRTRLLASPSLTGETAPYLPQVN